MHKRWMDILEKCILFKDIESDDLNVMLECLKPKVTSYVNDEIIAIAGDDFTEIGHCLKRQRSHSEGDGIRTE